MTPPDKPFLANSLFLLVARYQSPVVPLETIVKDYFSHLQIEEARRKANKQQLPFPVFRSEKDNKKSKWMVNIADLALYLDKESKIAKEDHLAMNG
ncbi:TPA: pyocin activator PrtN family protein [Acinetobacter baumannii]|uniref:pyocin activator PrtN family protein n=1 Tax=Acinetobacter baumannii TaxID=470 RepID=UPI00233EF408|nr:pyocin activator PrtN family protein [Acinetobacter baumannii]MDC5176934.1 pyocin activator PrtN family protein [Acinetobacter baumannii]MDC5569102.1 pyocin activator PrtN family protein [Acinetobacter baumannii]HAV4559848.1 hypothetical protein [Acinetobacter baumannii]